MGEPSAPQSTVPRRSQSQRDKLNLDKSYEILTCTVKRPDFSYAHLELVSQQHSSVDSEHQTQQQQQDSQSLPQLDEIQVKTYCTSALRQFLGLSGSAMPLDILKVDGAECWVRVPREDLSRFSAAMTAWKGVNEGGEHRILRLKQCSDWLGLMVGTQHQDKLWAS
jgi:ribonuclease P/MRP protein subunit POP8